MKKSFIILIPLLIFISCESATKENSVNDSDIATTLTIQNLQKDTMVVSFEYEDVIYFFDDNNRVIMIGKITNDDSIVIPTGIFILIMSIIFIIAVLTGIKLGLENKT